MNPRVTFIVPCYKLAHLLPECVNSILSQTFQDFEILIMDDCSPDDTPAVAQSFGDERIKHIRNEPNLGHLRNYNKGIGLARGEYIWLISADDCLSKPYVLERYVKVMDANPKIGYAFCAATGLMNGKEADLIKWARHSKEDRIFTGHEFLKDLLVSNQVVAGTGMVRRACYDKVGCFPLDMPYAGDWYLWCVFALYFDVAYFGEPMVYYRLHEQSMTSQFSETNARIFFEDDLNVLWGVMQMAEKAGAPAFVHTCEQSIVERYVNDIRDHLGASDAVSRESALEQSLSGRVGQVQGAKRVGAQVYARLGDELYWQDEFSHAARLYRQSLQSNSRSLRNWAKYFVSQTGGAGKHFAHAFLSQRRRPALGRDAR